MAIGTAVLASMSLPAQVTYSVFPAAPQRTSSGAEQPTNPGTDLVTLQVQDSTVAYVVHSLVHQAHLRLLYDFDNPVFARRITARVDHEQLMHALAVVLKGTGLVARIASDGETVMISGGSIPSSVKLGAGIIVGRVTDSSSGMGL
ncbi:MAG TPA: hypothetical protein VNU46_05500, partial [Gemmatimonadaceae bacterium]|nr:hypothetical protein [Gemmatimonadaceae bacterium]